MLKTRLTTLLGIRYPIISAPMALASGGGLATAVSEAGALGTFGAVNPWGAIGTDYVQEQIRHIRSRTDRPFGVGFITQAIQRAPRNFDAALDEAVRVIIFSFADPGPWLIRAKQAGAVTVCQVQSFEAARKVRWAMTAGPSGGAGPGGRGPEGRPRCARTCSTTVGSELGAIRRSRTPATPSSSTAATSSSSRRL